MMSFDLAINTDKAVFRYIEHGEDSSTFIVMQSLCFRNGMKNLECAVIRQSISNVAIPLDASVKPILPFDLNAADTTLK
jgi:hypothetical protein